MFLNQLEQSALYNAYNFSQASSDSSPHGHPVAGDAAANTTVVSTLVASFACPSDDQPEVVTRNPTTASDPFSANQARRSNYIFCTGTTTDDDCDHNYSAIPNKQRPPFYNGNSAQVRRLPRWAEQHGPGGRVGAGEDPAGVRAVLGCGGAHRRPRPRDPPGGPDHAYYLPNKPYKEPNPNKLQYSWTFGSRHSGGVNMVFGDGSVRFLKNAIDPSIWWGIQTVNGGEIIGSDKL